MDFKMILKTEDNKEIECDIVAKWTMNNENYVAYTTSEKSDGELEDLFVSKYIKENSEFKLIDITNDDEWQKVNEYLDEVLGDDDYE